MSYRLWGRGNARGWNDHGFSLIETLVVVVIIGLLAAIATPSWLKFWATRQVGAARDELRSGILAAQNAAIVHRSSWRFSLREADGHLEWAIHPNDVDGQDVVAWQALSANIILDEADTTLAESQGTHYVRFGFQGNVIHRLSTVTLDSQNGIAKNQCVVISTLIGATRKGEEQAYPQGERYCY